MGWYSGDRYDAFTLWNRLPDAYAPAYWALLVCNIFIPRFCGFAIAHQSDRVCHGSGVILVGWWLERFMHRRGQLASRLPDILGGMYYPTRWDWDDLRRHLGMFLAAMSCSCASWPAISILKCAPSCLRRR